MVGFFAGQIPIPLESNLERILLKLKIIAAAEESFFLLGCGATVKKEYWGKTDDDNASLRVN